MVAEAGLDLGLFDRHLLKLVLRISPVGVPGECPRRPRLLAPPTSYARRPHNPEGITPILSSQIKNTATPRGTYHKAGLPAEKQKEYGRLFVLLFTRLALQGIVRYTF